MGVEEERDVGSGTPNFFCRTSGGYIGDNSSQNFQVFGSPECFFYCFIATSKANIICTV